MTGLDLSAGISSITITFDDPPTITDAQPTASTMVQVRAACGNAAVAPDKRPYQHAMLVSNAPVLLTDLVNGEECAVSIAAAQTEEVDGEVVITLGPATALYVRFANNCSWCLLVTFKSKQLTSIARFIRRCLQPQCHSWRASTTNRRPGTALGWVTASDMDCRCRQRCACNRLHCNCIALCSDARCTRVQAVIGSPHRGHHCERRHPYSHVDNPPW